MSENKYIYSKITRGESPSYDKFVTKDELNEVKEELLSEIETTDTILDNHLDDLNNPHEVTKAQIGLGDVVNKPMDSEVTEDSENYISSGAVKIYVDTHGRATWGQITGTLSNQTDLSSALNNKQATLISGENIKTINSQSLLGSGDIEIKSYRTFPVSWTKDSTTRDFCQDIENDTSAEPGDIYFGTLECSDLPGNMIQAEATVEIISNGANGKCINIITTSLNTSPYRWNYSYGRVNGTITVVGWTGVQAEINANNKLNANLVNGLATVATTGSYNDLSNKPSIPAVQIQSDWNQTNSSKKDYIKNKPQVQNIYNSQSEDAQSGQAVAMAVAGAVETAEGYVANNYYNQNEINDFLELTIDENDIDQEHSSAQSIAIIPETAEKIKSFKYRLKFKSQLVDPSANPGNYYLFSPSNVVTNVDIGLFDNPGDCYSFTAGQGSMFSSGSFQTILFFNTHDDIYDLDVFYVIGLTNDQIPKTLMTATEYGHSVLCLGDGDGGTFGATIPFQEPLISGSNIKTINNQNILNSGNIDIPEISFIADINTTTGATNINGKNLSAYNVISYTSGDYTGYEIKQNNESLNETQAAQFLKGLTGNPILPVYNYDYPNNSYLIRATDGQILKPQYDSNGLKLYNMQKIVTNKTGMPYLTTAPTSDNLSGGLQFVVLSSEPQTKYNGYIYFITSSSN